MRKLIRRLGYLRHRGRLEAELAEEMEFHRALKEQEAGGSAAASRRAMGNQTLAREEARAVWLAPWLESLGRDLAYGVRMMRRQPGFTLVALLALGSTIGLNTSLFTLYNALALRPWPVRDPGRVVSINRMIPPDPAHNRPAANTGFPVVEYRYLAEHTHALSAAVAIRSAGQVKLDGNPARWGFYVSGNYFQALGVPMERGRGFLTAEDRTGDPQAVAVISFGVWQNLLGSDPQVVGRVVRLDGVPFRVVGVASRDFTATGTELTRTDIWMPLPAMALLRPNDPTVKAFLNSRDFCCAQLAGRLAPGVSREQAQSEVELLLHSFASMQRERVLMTGTALLANPSLQRKAVPIFSLLFLAVTLVLLLACANVGNLLLARAAARRQEIAVRLSVGGSRARLVRQFLIESLTLALAAAGIGLLVADQIPSLVVRRLSDSVILQLSPDWHVLAYTALLATVSCAAFGLAPALHATRGEIAGALKNQSPLAGVRLSLRGLLLGVQVAISVMLLAGAGLLVRGLQSAQRLDPGFAVRDVTVVHIGLPADAYGGMRTAAFIGNLFDGLRSSSDLPAWGLSYEAPLSNSTFATSFRLPNESDHENKVVATQAVTSGYFEVLRIPVQVGRNFSAADMDRPVAVINQTMAARYWPNGAVGRILVSNNAEMEIVGVVRDAATTGLGRIEPILYLPLSGRRGLILTPVVLLRSSGPAAVERIASVVKGIERRAEIGATPLEDNFQMALRPAASGAVIAGVLGMLALTLASIGMAGVFAYTVRQRTREIGIRMALGAQPREVIRVVLQSSARALGAGLAAGLVAAAALSRVLASSLYGASTLDPLAYGGVLLLLALAAAVASAGPARRATRLDPVAALRSE